MIKNNKILIVSLIVLILSMGVVSFAKVESNIDSNIEFSYNNYDRFKKKLEFRKDLVLEDYNNKRITKEEKDLWIEHFDSMIENYENQESYGYGYGTCCNGFGGNIYNNTRRMNRHNRINQRIFNNMQHNNMRY